MALLLPSGHGRLAVSTDSPLGLEAPHRLRSGVARAWRLTIIIGRPLQANHTIHASSEAVVPDIHNVRSRDVVPPHLRMRVCTGGSGCVAMKGGGTSAHGMCGISGRPGIEDLSAYGHQPLQPRRLGEGTLISVRPFGHQHHTRAGLFSLSSLQTTRLPGLAFGSRLSQPASAVRRRDLR